MRELRPRSPECLAVGDLLSDYLDGDLDQASRQRVEAHLQTCPLCTADLEDMRLTVRALRALPMVEPPRSFALPVPPRHSSWFFRLRLATSAVAALLVLTIVANVSLPMGASYSPAEAPISLMATEEVSEFAPTAAQPELRSAPADLPPPQPMGTPAPPVERAAAGAAQASTPATSDATAPKSQEAAAPQSVAPTAAPEGTPLPSAAPAPEGTPVALIAAAPAPTAPTDGAGENAESDNADQAQKNGAGEDLPAGAANTMLAPEAPGAGMAERQTFASDAPAASMPSWRLWLTWLPYALGPLVVILGAATTLTWLRERR